MAPARSWKTSRFVRGRRERVGGRSAAARLCEGERRARRRQATATALLSEPGGVPLPLADESRNVRLWRVRVLERSSPLFTLRGSDVSNRRVVLPLLQRRRASGRESPELASRVVPLNRCAPGAPASLPATCEQPNLASRDAGAPGSWRGGPPPFSTLRFVATFQRVAASVYGVLAENNDLLSLPLNLPRGMVRTCSPASQAFRAKSGTRWNTSLPGSGAQGASKRRGGLSSKGGEGNGASASEHRAACEEQSALPLCE